MGKGCDPPGERAASPEDVTELLSRVRNRDDPAARDQLVAMVYDELRRLAHRRMARRGPDPSLEPTGLVHEALIRLMGRDTLEAVDREHFFAIAARAMRDVLIDRARKRAAAKRGGTWNRVPLDDVARSDPDTELLSLHEALAQLEAVDPASAQVVMYRYFAGLTREETATVLGVSPATVARDWAYARAWLRRRLAAETESDHG